MNPKATIRPAVKSDLNRILEIESQNPYSWEDSKFDSCFNANGTLCLIVEYKGIIYGFMVYCITNESVIVLNITVDNSLRRCGLGGNLIKALKTRIDTVKRLCIDVIVPEYDLVSQLFFKHCGFKCVDTIKGYYLEDEAESDVGYMFKYQPK